MKEITSPVDLFCLNINVQNMPAIQSGFKVHRAWELAENWYSVELTDSRQRILRGIIDKSREIMYLDAASTMALVNELILEHLDAFNAGHHWRYKGL